MDAPRVIDRGRGPEIEGTRITVYTILEYLRADFHQDQIAAVLQLSSAQVRAAVEYIQQNETHVTAEYDSIMDRIGQGNPAWVEEKLKASREKLTKLLARHQSGDAQHAGNHVR